MSIRPLAGRSDWVTTYTGGTFFPLAPRVEDVRIEDIAHALSNLCRFAGHVSEFYSVAQHSVLVSQICDPDDGLWGLLHDASEAYLCDIVSPVKRAPALAGYREVEHGVMQVIAQACGLPIDEPMSVKRADRALLRLEQRELMRMPSGWHAGDVPNLYLVPWPPALAKTLFLARYDQLRVR